MMKRLISLLILLFSFSFANGQKTDAITLIDNAEIKLDLIHHLDADISKKDWIKIKLRNKSRKSLFIKELNYSINTFENNNEGERVLRPGALGRSKMFNLIPHYHNNTKPTKEERTFELRPKKELEIWKYPTNTASAILENKMERPSEVCALMEVEIEYGPHSDISDGYTAEEAFCFNWDSGNNISAELIAHNLNEKIKNVTQRKINSAIINTMVLNKDAVKMVSVDSIVYGLHSRGYTQNKSERLALLKMITQQGAFNNKNLISHYESCMQDRSCEWASDLKYYWHEDLFDPLIASPLFINEKIKILETHSKSWQQNEELKEKFLNHALSKIEFDFNYVPDQEGFQDWYYKIKSLATTRHPKVIKYLMSLLDNETFLRLDDWSGQMNKRVRTRKDKPKTIFFRICDVAYVGLLRALNKVKLNNTFEGFKYTQSVIINEKWRGLNTESKNPVRMKNAYTVIPFNLSMAEKFYYLYEDNKKEIRKSLRRHGY